MEPLVRAPQDASDWEAYERLARRCFNEPALGTGPLRARALTRLAETHGEVLSGAMALRCEAFFGGAAVPAAGIACVAVAPEARGRGLAARTVASLADRLREEGRAVALLWTPATGVYRRWGWEVGGLGRGWSLPLTALADMPRPRRIEPGPGKNGAAFQRLQASAWDGALSRPSWWWSWKYPEDDDTRFLYHVPGADGSTVGLVGYEHRAGDGWGYDLLVTDMWSADRDTERELHGFLAGHSSQAHRLLFDQAALASPPSFLWELPHHRAAEQGWYPWMIRLLDVPAALTLRGWPPGLAGSLEFGIEHAGGSRSALVLTVDSGGAAVRPGGTGAVGVTETALAAWYCGALPRAHLRRLLPGVPPGTVEFMAALTSGSGPWLPDVF
ncbi:GNAT family N-acetyltransferase [Nocardiopsis sp. ARC36]